MTLECARELHMNAMLRKANATVRTRNLSVFQCVYYLRKPAKEQKDWTTG
ncbi:unnamed protein product [Coregonus sp. 'balchen']|nr:unnamed protein product [Coregonus sp. 'balchen']